MKHVSFKQVDILDGFWKSRQEINRKISIYAVRDRFAETGRFDAFQLNWKEGMPNRPHVFWDSDIAKWMEGASFILQKHPDKKLQEIVEGVIDLIEQNQQPDGYFNIYFTVCEPENRFTRRTDHELYCAGHLMEAAVAYYDATGRDRFLRLMCKYADCIEKAFKIEKTAKFVTPGHEEIELALVKLYRCTGEKRYLDLSKFFVDMRGKCDAGQFYDFANAKYDQSHLPVREQSTAEGHCVRACYLYSAMADLALEYHDTALADACKRIFHDIANTKLYITGGIGQSHVGEAFTLPYDLPNKIAYTETCAAISLAYFAQRMLAIRTDAIYADVVERIIYNGMLSGISLDGRRFFYENPLEIEPRLKDRDTSILESHRSHFPITQRVEVFDCSCCPPNLNRFIASIGDFLYSMDGDTCYVHQFMDSAADVGSIAIRQQTNYPHDGKIKLSAKGAKRLAVRVPGWCSSYRINQPYYVENGYAYINATTAEVEFDMHPMLIAAPPLVQENAGRAAVQRGPLVYCLEAVDNGPLLRSVSVNRGLNAKLLYDETIGANRILTDGCRPADSAKLYHPLDDFCQNVRLQFIPYFAFANRGESEMIVWVNYQ